MWNWLRELYEIRRENRELNSICPACEVFKVELSNMRRERDILLNRVLTPTSTPETQITGDPQPVILRHMPWKVKQQELERQDRLEHERILTEFKNKVSPLKTEELEKSIGIKDG